LKQLNTKVEFETPIQNQILEENSSQSEESNDLSEEEEKIMIKR
jgi:hypothetical protein